MLFSKEPGLIVISGPVKSGKSAELLNIINSYVGSKKSGYEDILVFKHPSVDKKGKIYSYNTSSYEAIETDSLNEIWEKVKEDDPHYIFIAGIHNYSSHIINLLKELQYIGKRVFVTGLNIDNDGFPYENTGKALSIAQEIILKKGICDICGEKALYSVKKNGKWVARCLDHYEGKSTGKLTMIIGPMFSSKTKTLFDYISYENHRDEIKRRDSSYYVINHKLDKKRSEKLKKGKEILMYNPSVSLEEIVNTYPDDMSLGYVSSHDGRFHEAIYLEKSSHLINIVDLIYKKKRGSGRNTLKTFFINEGQFFEGLYGNVKELLLRGINVYIAALSKDFRGEPFGKDIPLLLAIADEIVLKRAICECGEEATEIVRFIEEKKNGEDIVRVASYYDDIVVVGGKDLYKSVCNKCLVEKYWIDSYPFLFFKS